MYKQVFTDKECILDNDTKCFPVATLADESGGRVQVTIDDHCNVLRLKKTDGRYKATPYIFKEAFDLLVTMSPPV